MQLQLHRQRNNFPLVIICLMMLFSLYMPYSSTISIIYQLFAVMVTLLIGKNSAISIIMILLFSTTRSFIAVSTQQEFVEYLGINPLMLLICEIGLLCLCIYKQRGVFRVSLPILSLMGFASLMLLSQVWAPSTDEYNASYNSICLLYVVTPLLIRDEEDVYYRHLAFILSGAFLAIGIIPHLLFWGPIYTYNVRVDRNYQASLLLMCILETIVFLLEYYKKIPKTGIIACVLVIFGDMYILLTSASRSAFLSLIIAVCIFTMLNLGKKKKHFLPIITVVCAFIVLSEMGLFDTVLGRFNLNDVESGNGRMDLWRQYLEGFFEGNIIQILFGHSLVGQLYFGKAAHNLFISILYSFGLVGISLICSVIFAIIHGLYQSGHKNYLISFIPILFMCMTIEPYYRVEFAIYLSSLLATSQIYYRRKKYVV